MRRAPRAQLLVLLAASLAVSGCAELPFLAGDVSGWQPRSCDPSGAMTLSRNAPLAAGFRQDPAVIATDLGDVVADPVTAPQVAHGSPTWSTVGGGSIALSLLPDGRFFMAQYQGPAAIDRFVVEDLLRRWSVDVDQVWMGNGLLSPGDPSDGPAFQMAHDLPIAWANGGATWVSRPGSASTLTVLPFYDLAVDPASPSAVDRGTARVTGERFALCHLAQEGFTPDVGYRLVSSEVVAVGALHDSLSYVVAVETGGPGCGDRGHVEWVYVDSTTGAVAGSHAEPCVRAAR